jgi:hypothetical protein
VHTITEGMQGSFFPLGPPAAAAAPADGALAQRIFKLAEFAARSGATPEILSTPLQAPPPRIRARDIKNTPI